MKFSDACSLHKLGPLECAHVRSQMLAPEHTCATGSDGLVVRVPLLLDASFDFDVTLLGGEKHVVRLERTHSVNHVAKSFCVGHSLNSIQCTQLEEALRDFLGKCLGAETRKAILDRVEHSIPGSCRGGQPGGIPSEDECAEARAYAEKLTVVLPRAEGGD